MLSADHAERGLAVVWPAMPVSDWSYIIEAKSLHTESLNAELHLPLSIRKVSSRSIVLTYSSIVSPVGESLWVRRGLAVPSAELFMTSM